MTTNRIMAETLLTIVLFSFVAVLIKSISANAVTIGVVRLSSAGVLMFCWLRFDKRPLLPEAPKLGALALIGLAFGGHWLLFFLSIKVSTPSIAIIALSSYGIYLLIWGELMQKNRPRLIDMLAVLIAVLGNIILVESFTLGDQNTLGIVYGVVSAALLSFLPILHQRNSEIPDSTRAFWQFAGGLPVFLAFWPQTDWDLPGMDWLLLGVLSVVCTFVAHTFWIRVTTRLNTITCSLVYYLTIPLGMTNSYLILSEEMTARKLLGAALIMTANAVGLYSQWERQKLWRTE